MSNLFLRGIYLRLAGAVTLVVMLALLANAVLSHRVFEQALAPQLASKAYSVGASVRALVNRAVENGVSFSELYGVTERFTEVKEEVPEISYIGISDLKGKVLYRSAQESDEAAAHFRSKGIVDIATSGTKVSGLHRIGPHYLVSMPILGPNGPLGVLHLGIDVRFVDQVVVDMLFDVLVILVVSLFFALELLHYIAGARLEASLKDLSESFERGASGDFRTRRRAKGEQAFGYLHKMLYAMLMGINGAYASLVKAVAAQRHLPAHERAPDLAAIQAECLALGQKHRFGMDETPLGHDSHSLAKIRAPLFVFILAEELTRSFLPAYTQDLLVPVPGLSPQLVLGLPIALFMLIVALAQPFMGVFCERRGHKSTMLIGASIAAAGFFATAMASSVLDLLVWRSLCAVGYAMVFVAGQAFVLDHATPATRARSFALFVGAIMAATVCGPSIGGILADNIGTRPTFALAGLLALLSLVVIRGLPDLSKTSQSRPPTRLPTLREIGHLMINHRFMRITALAAMPAKILLTGVCFYLVPLYVLTIGSTPSMAGRILMTYAVVMVVMAPITAGLATNRQRMHALVGGGLIVSGLGGLLLLAGGDVLWVFGAVILIGLGQSMSISAQSALVSEHCAQEIRAMGEGVIYGVYRLLERIGNALGPMIAGALVLHFDYVTGFALIGLAVILCGIAFLFATRRAAEPVWAPASVHT
ncbi:MAG: MFS transporter [Rubrivivax sp.]|nr:MFS transporter [Rubrivivax sp.]